MYLSKLIMNPRERNVLNDLSNPYQMHRSVMSGFPQDLPADERVLFRLEIRRKVPYLVLLVQSHSQPDWEELTQRGYLLRPASVKPFEMQFAAEQIYRFRLLANPTKRIKMEGKEKSTRVGLMREEDQTQWLIRKGEQHGFRVLSAQAAKVVQPDGLKLEDEKEYRISYYAVQFDGLLQVAEAEPFSLACRLGIGSGKGMGFGLLSLGSAGG